MKLDGKYLLRLLGIQLLFAFLTYLLLYSSLGVLPAADWFHWGIMLLLLGIYWFALYLDNKIKGSSDMGANLNAEKEFKHQGKDSAEAPKTFYIWKGFLHGLLAQIPIFLAVLVLIVLRRIAPSAAYSLESLLKLWFFCLTTLFDTYANGIVPAYVYFGMSAGFILFVGMGYRAGEAHRKHIEIMIQRNSERIRNGHRPDEKK